MKVIIREHKVIWDYEKTLPLRLIVDRNGMLQDLEMHFEVLQEYSSGARGETIILGNIKLNLAEFVEGSDDGEAGVTRRYLMQESKINSTLKVWRRVTQIRNAHPDEMQIGIDMKQTEGDRNFIASVSPQISHYHPHSRTLAPPSKPPPSSAASPAS